MRPVLLGVALVAGGLSGGLAWSAMRAPAPTPEVVASRTCERDRQEARSRLAFLRSEVERAGVEVGAARRLRAARLGSTLPWPDPVPPQLTPEAVRAHVEDALEGTRARLLDVNCAAYPCVAVLSTGHDPAIDFRFVKSPVEGEANLPGDILARLRADEYDSFPLFETGRLAGAASVNEPTLHAVLFFSPSDAEASERPADPALVEQDGTRLDQIQGRLLQQISEWETKPWK